MTVPSKEATRVTMALNKTEDRISLVCALPDSESAELWLTARLARQLIPHLLEEPARLPEHSVNKNEREIVGDGEPGTHDTAVIADRDTPSWLVTAIDIHRGPSMVQLCFRNERHYPAISLGLEYTQLGQWLAGLKQCYIQADWPMDCWQPPKDVNRAIGEMPQLTLH